MSTYNYNIVAATMVGVRDLSDDALYYGLGANRGEFGAAISLTPTVQEPAPPISHWILSTPARGPMIPILENVARAVLEPDVVEDIMDGSLKIGQRYKDSQGNLMGFWKALSVNGVVYYAQATDVVASEGYVVRNEFGDDAPDIAAAAEPTPTQNEIDAVHLRIDSYHSSFVTAVGGPQAARDGFGLGEGLIKALV